MVCVMSGGGAKAAAHIGAHRALEEHGIRPARYVGTSMGAVVAACFAAGLGHDEVLRRMLGVSRSDIAIPSLTLFLGPFARSLLSGKRLRATIERLVPAERFDELAVPLTVTAVDADTGALELFGAGGDQSMSLVDALSASSALPMYYPPKEIAGRHFVDGGLRAVLPLDVAARFDPDWVFAVRVGPSFAAEAPEESPVGAPLLEAHNLAMRTFMAAQADEAIVRWRDGAVPLVLVEPTVQRGATFDVSSAVRYVEDGYAQAMRALRSADVLGHSAAGVGRELASE
jgi:predicted acylesterase/phospholipase RssA